MLLCFDAKLLVVPMELNLKQGVHVDKVRPGVLELMVDLNEFDCGVLDASLGDHQVHELEVILDQVGRGLRLLNHHVNR